MFKAFLTLIKENTYWAFSISVFLLSLFTFTNPEITDTTECIIAFLATNIGPHFMIWTFVFGIKLQLFIISIGSPILDLYFGFLKLLSFFMITLGICTLPMSIFLLVKSNKHHMAPIIIILGITLIMMGYKNLKMLKKIK